ncbi:MAG: hypothetical protein M2R45_03607 [Verrucomicrobia subdivision 3 bacterium]|nr:hypothetical protein [Limisphaerales bacterium]MCS1416898.1 hypothetical protein [Limisphaerales bacterium]
MARIQQHSDIRIEHPRRYNGSIEILIGEQLAKITVHLLDDAVPQIIPTQSIRVGRLVLPNHNMNHLWIERPKQGNIVQGHRPGLEDRKIRRARNQYFLISFGPGTSPYRQHMSGLTLIDFFQVHREFVIQTAFRARHY